MRYYEIVISPSQKTSNFTPITFSSLYNGQDNYAALQITLDIFQAPFHSPAGNAVVEIFGIDYNVLKRNLTFANISIKVGMTKGLPLIKQNTTQIISGTILENFGNWQGTHVSLFLVIAPQIFDPLATQNITFSWQKGKTLTDAVTSTLINSYKVSVTGGYSPNLVFPETLNLQFTNLISFGTQINVLSKAIITDPNYIGATIIPSPSGFILNDGTLPQTQSIVHTDIRYEDIIGNVTWLNYSTLQMKIVMRGDINIGDYVNIPKGVPILNTVSSYAQVRNNMSFTGNFYVSQVRHVGNFRQADANSWVTVIDMVAPYQLSNGIQPA